ncbi:glycoside hydrolase family 15 [Kineococcus rubinsiae]|uniref:glycoside hydrolase family 15 n=1 Tax=Kineococcus rubinsiae TaxID=2609562 RepID=UPI00142F9299|nr:glycoside hydrolase family 15 [Kineococcus rubinsiae]NIZ93371.1 glycoside hydrolase family 15 [Kineococcus rubinsiae]
MRHRWSALAAALGSLLVLTATTAVPARTEAAPPRLLTGADWRAPLAAGEPSDAAWLAAGTVPGADGPWGPMVRQGLLDLRGLSRPNGALEAAPTQIWRYAWPRDSAFAAVALSATGHRDDALRALDFLAGVQLADGGFEARYLLTGHGAPDDRPRQGDGAGWALWALGEVVADAPDAATARADLTALRPLLSGASDFLLAGTGDGTRLPAPSPDYWERPETELTLGTAAAQLAGLRAAARLFPVLGEDARARTADRAARRLARLVRAEFRPGGYQRYARSGRRDAAVTFLLPPFADAVDPGVLAAVRGYQSEALRGAGGLAPGAGWRDDGISWTPETALTAYALAASGADADAARWLDWLAAHRTAWGSLPERVLADGTPAGPAPLGWSAASVVLAVAALG